MYKYCSFLVLLWLLHFLKAKTNKTFAIMFEYGGYFLMIPPCSSKSRSRRVHLWLIDRHDKPLKYASQAASADTATLDSSSLNGTHTQRVKNIWYLIEKFFVGPGKRYMEVYSISFLVVHNKSRPPADNWGFHYILCLKIVCLFSST